MILNSLKKNGRYIFKQKRFTFNLTSSKENHYDVIPFNFNEIDKLVKINQNYSQKPIIEDNSHNELIYELANQTRYIMYYSITTKKKHSKNIDTDSLAPTKILPEYHKEHEILCRNLYKYLPYMNKDDLIAVLMRSTPAHYYTNYKCWYVLSKSTVRYIFSTRERLSCQDIVTLLISLSKWHFPGLNEIIKKLDYHIIINPNWNLDSSSNVLWSLFLLKIYNSKSLNYLNGLLVYILNTNDDLHFQNYFSDNIHKISQVNLDSITSLRNFHPVTLSIINYFQRNPQALKCLDPKALVSITNILRYSQYNDTLTTNILSILMDTIHNFNSSYITEIFYTFSIIQDSLSKEAENKVVSLLFKFRDLAMNSNIILLPKEVSIILFTNRNFLKNVDLMFTSKCLADIVTNIHLLGFFSTIGNMFCLNQILIDFSDKLDNHHREWIKDTFKYLSNISISGFLVDFNDKEQKHITKANHNLWHLAAVRNLGIRLDYSLKFNEFYENYKNRYHESGMKNLFMFLANSIGNRDLMDYYYRNLVLLTCSKIYPKKEREILLGYWSFIECFLVCFNIYDEFKKELGFEPNITTDCNSTQLLNILSSIFGKRSFDESLEVLEKLSSKRDKETGNEEIMIIKLFILQYISETNEDIAKKIFQDFYSPNINLGTVYIKGSENVAIYITKCLYSSCTPITTDILYTRLFFLQNQHKNILKILPSIVIGEAFKTKMKDHDIYKIGEWLEREKNWNCLSRFFKTNPMNWNKGEIREDKEVKQIYTNWKIEEMEINYILENHYIGPWMCPYTLKNKDINKSILIFPMEYKFNNNLHIFDKIKREFLSKFGYNFIEIYYE